MYCTFLLFASYFICQISSEPVSRIILDYFKSESVLKFRNEWEKHRKPLEHAVTTALSENEANTGMNVYIRKKKQDLAVGFYHNDNQVRLILTNIRLKEIPRFWLPEVQFSLASNVLKIRLTLSKMIIHADYVIMRNHSAIVHDPIDQDPYKTSPFLFPQVSDAGNIAITMDGCELNGFIITSLSGESVNLGYDHIRLLNCQHGVEIYRDGDEYAPVIAKYNPYRDDDGLRLTELLLKPLSEELVPKMQAAMFTYINTSSIFDEDLQEFRENQDIVFQTTWSYLTEIVRKLNKITIDRNGGAIEIKDVNIFWDDGAMKSKKNHTVGETILMVDMVLTGLDTLYCAHSGGPYKMKTVMIGEEIRFSSLQIRGNLEMKTTSSERYAFAAEITDLVVDLQLELNPDQGQNGLKTLEVVGYRRIVFTTPAIVLASAEALVSGYLMNEVPKLLIAHLKSIFPEVLGGSTKISDGTPEENTCGEGNAPKNCPGSYETTCSNKDTNKICKTKCKSADCVCKPGYVSIEGECWEEEAAVFRTKFQGLYERKRLRRLQRKKNKKSERNNKIRK